MCVAAVRGSLPRSISNAQPRLSVSTAVALVSSEAIEQAVASSAPEIALAATALGPTRGMRRVPRLGCGIVAQAFAVDMADHRRTLGAARPVAAGPVLAGRKSPA